MLHHQTKIALCIALFFLTIANTQSITSNWKQYKNVETAGFSKAKLDSLAKILKNTDTAALLVIYKGNVLFSYGDNTRRYAIHSMRKSIMNAMIGREIENGTVKLNQSLHDLNIDDIGKLTLEEKKATIKDLLSARAGVYHPSAYYERNLAKALPARGSNSPGTHWTYNNWDFNVLSTIYNQQSGKDFFLAFKKELAEPLGMEDFRMIDTYYRLESDKSIHPAYLFKMSTRDLAKFGQLYLNNGQWGNKQLISKSWIKQSTMAQTKSENMGRFSSKGSYGFLWWRSAILDIDYFYASGAGGHRIIIVPDYDMVFVHRVNTYEGKRVNDTYISKILSSVINAKTKQMANKLSGHLTPYEPVKKINTNSYNKSMDQFLGTYAHRFLGKMTIKKIEEKYILQTGIGLFNLFKTSDNTFYAEDLDGPIIMKKTTDPNEKQTIVSVMSKEKNRLEKVIFYY